MNPEILFATLEGACYGDGQTQQNAMRCLQDFETIEGFVLCLIHLIENVIPATKADCGLLAMISLKNVINRYWVPRGATSSRFLNMEEKHRVKMFLLQQVCAISSAAVLTATRVGKQLIVVIAKVARLDWPNDWSDLLPTLFGTVQQSISSSSLTISTSSNNHDRLLLPSLYSILNELSTKTILIARKGFVEATTQMFPHLADMWVTVTNQFASMLRTISSSGIFDLQLAQRTYMLTKVMDIILKKSLTSICGGTAFPSFVEHFVRQVNQCNTSLKEAAYALVLPPELSDFLEEYVVTSVSSSCSEGNDEFDIDSVIEAMNTVVQSSHNAAQYGPTISVLAVLVTASHVSAKISSTLAGLQKDFPLHIVPFLEGLLQHSYSQLGEHVGKQGLVPGDGSHVQGIDGGHGDGSSSNDRQHRLHVSMTTSSCIHITLLISNVLSCSAYSTEESVAKRKEKLQLKLQNQFDNSGAGRAANTNSSIDHDVDQVTPPLFPSIHNITITPR